MPKELFKAYLGLCKTKDGLPMEEKMEINKFCEECREKTQMKFIKRKGEYLLYECSVCDSVHEFTEQDLGEDMEEDLV